MLLLNKLLQSKIKESSRRRLDNEIFIKNISNYNEIDYRL